MKKLLLIIPVFLLTGCLSTAPVKRNFPQAIPEIMQACPELKEVSEGTKELSKMLDVVVQNYGTYYECRVKMDAWIKWYNEQKQNFDSVK